MMRICLFSVCLALMSTAALAATSDASAGPGAGHGMDAKYKEIGAATLGTPAGAEGPAADGGRSRPYSNGAIYWSKATGAHAVFGPAYEKYKSLGAERGKLGYPVTDVLRNLDGREQTLFQHGFILIGKSGAVATEVMPQAAFTADSIMLKGISAKKMAPNEVFVESMPQSGSGFTYSCACYNRKDEIGTGSCDLQIRRDVIRCAGTGCRNTCKLKPVSGAQ